MNDSLNDARTPREPDTEGSPQEHGAGNREHGAGVVGPQAPSIVTAVDARAQLRRLAEATGSQTWTFHGRTLWRGDVGVELARYEVDGDEAFWPYPDDAGIDEQDVFAGEVWRNEDGAYAAAACPSRVLQLLDALDRIDAVLAEPDDVQWWPVQPYTDPPDDDEVVEVQVVNVARLRAAIDGPAS